MKMKNLYLLPVITLMLFFVVNSTSAITAQPIHSSSSESGYKQKCEIREYAGTIRGPEPKINLTCDGIKYCCPVFDGSSLPLKSTSEIAQRRRREAEEMAYYERITAGLVDVDTNLDKGGTSGSGLEAMVGNYIDYLSKYGSKGSEGRVAVENKLNQKFCVECGKKKTITVDGSTSDSDLIRTLDPKDIVPIGDSSLTEGGMCGPLTDSKMAQCANGGVLIIDNNLSGGGSLTADSKGNYNWNCVNPDTNTVTACSANPTSIAVAPVGTSLSSYLAKKAVATKAVAKPKAVVAPKVDAIFAQNAFNNTLKFCTQFIKDTNAQNAIK